MIAEQIDHSVPDILETEIEATAYHLDDNIIFPENTFESQITKSSRLTQDLLLDSNQAIDPLRRNCHNY